MSRESIKGSLRTRHVRGSGRLLAWAGVCGVLWVLWAAPAPGQDAATETPAAATPAGELDQSTPRSAMRGFLQACIDDDYERAAAVLDLHNVAQGRRTVAGPALARKLSTVLDRELWVNLDELSDDPQGETNDGLPSRRDLVGTINTPKGPVKILLERVSSGDQAPIWKIASATVAQIPALYQEFGYGPLGELLPAPFFEVRFLRVELWQWIGLLLLVLVAYALSWLIASLLIRALHRLVARSRTTIDDQLLTAAAGPFRFVVAIALFSGAVPVLALSVPATSFVTGLAKIAAIATITWFVVRLVDVFARMVEERFIARRHVALTLVPMGRRTAKVIVVALASVAMLQNVGFNVTSLLAGLGLGGLAVALAAQKTVENLFGGVTLIADQPIRVGDFCRFGDKVGTVEDIGLRSTRVRTLDRTVVSIPNSEFAGMQLENFGRRDRIWLHPTIGLRYETTPDQLRFVLIELKKMLLAHPKVDPAPARVRFSGFGAYSLDLDIFAYILTSDINEFLAIQEDINLRIMDIVNASGTGFAFPSQTIYTGADSGLDETKSRAAEAHVQSWRGSNTLYLPDFPPDQAAAIDDTLDYPPKGSPAAAAG